MSLCCVVNFLAYRTAQLSKANNQFMIIAQPMFVYFSILKHVCVTFLALGPIVKPLSPGKRSNLVWPKASFYVTILFHPFQPKMGPLGLLEVPTGYFLPIWHTFWPTLMSSVLFQPCSNQFSKKYGIKAYFVIFGPTLSSFSNFWSQRDNFCII